MSLEQEIHEITQIPIAALRGQVLSGFSFEERMSWAAERTTTLKEDKVYCLLGIFGVFLSLIYGEGEAYATLRLKEEIQKRQEGLGTGSPRNLSGTPSPSKAARLCASCIHLTVHSTLVTAIHSKRTLYWTQRRAPLPRTVPPCLQHAPAEDDIRAGRMRKVSACYRVCVLCTGNAR